MLLNATSFVYTDVTMCYIFIKHMCKKKEKNPLKLECMLLPKREREREFIRCLKVNKQKMKEVKL